ncbi:Mitochondrial inner membrane magnesium transporter mrs2 [Porphyridium purpureum]|uniref:Magnesium transporter n=1 Tax=Porphyridium purpureum TaxID=35688 RepID=A0A5J4YRP2_PORPP|nr:Mitochondrial inner membrane magnesium transporter mrs2 [Porphyridium purpureum]|eukprot:POR1047..scf236_6
MRPWMWHWAAVRFRGSWHRVAAGGVGRGALRRYQDWTSASRSTSLEALEFLAPGGGNVRRDAESVSTAGNGTNASGSSGSGSAVKVRTNAGERGTLRNLTKADLAATTGLNLRDIRNVDPSFRQESPAVLVRSKAIIVNLEHIRAILQADRLLLFEPMHPSVQAFIPELQARLQAESSLLPFELRALEVVLINVCASLQRHASTLSPAVDSVLDNLSSTGVSSFGSDSVQTSLDRLLPLENALNEFLNKVTMIRTAIDDVLSSDEDMSAMYLTSVIQSGHRRRRDEHEEVEMMLENYMKVIDSVHNEISATLRAVKSTENVTQIRLDAMRNRVLRLEVYLNIATVSIASGGTVAACFGMNLLSGLEESPHAFYAISLASVSTCVLMFRGILAFLKFKRIFR